MSPKKTKKSKAEAEAAAAAAEAEAAAAAAATEVPAAEEKNATADAAAAPQKEEPAPAETGASAPDKSATPAPLQAMDTSKAVEECEAKDLAHYDLTYKIAPYLDKHLLLNMLHFLKETGIYKFDDIARAELQLVNCTNMIDLAEDKYNELEEEIPDGLARKKEQVIDQIDSVQASLFSLLHTLENEEAMRKLHNAKNRDEVLDELNKAVGESDARITSEQIEGLVSYAKLQYECGSYEMSGTLLKYYRILNELEPETTKSLWGSIASLLLSNDFEGASENSEKLATHLESAKMSRKEVLLQKTWLLHWSLWALFKAEQVPQKSQQLFMSDKSLSIISLSCPHLFRYVAACLILQKRLKLSMKDTVHIIHLEAHAYSDPITRFLVALYTELDFDGAQQELQMCKNVCKSDFFLAGHWNEFEENARLLIFETYCQIHQCIYIEMIASKLNMTPAEAELWIVKLIQSAKLDARIDSEKSRVVMSKAPASVYQQVIEKTKNLSFRSTMLLSNLEKKEAAGKS